MNRRLFSRELIWQELSHMKEAVKSRTPVSMDTLVQQTESPFTTEVLHFTLPTKFRMPQVEAFDGMRDPVDHLNTYKNQMELHGYKDPVRCRAFAITVAPLSQPDPFGRVRTESGMPLKSLNHSKSYLYGSDFKIWASP